MPGSRESAGDTLESLSGTGLLLVSVCLEVVSPLPLLFVFSRLRISLSRSQTLPSSPLLLNVFERSSWLRRDWRRFDFEFAPRHLSLRRCSGGIKVKVFKEENYLVNWIKVRDFLVCLITTLLRFALGEMTVRETLAFSARVQGVGAGHAKLLLELSRREKEANIKPDPDLDLFMKQNVMPFNVVVLQVGNYIPISQVRDDVATAYKKEMEWKTSKRHLPQKQLCSEKKVEAEIVQIEAMMYQLAISNEVSRSIYFSRWNNKYERFGAWGCFAFGEDTKDIITTNLEKLLLCFQSGDSGATHLALLILPTGHAIRSSVLALLWSRRKLRWFHRSLSSSSSLVSRISLSPISNPTFLSFAPQRLPSDRVGLGETGDALISGICALSSSAITLSPANQGEMTVRETLAFSARVQGVGAGHGKCYILLLELSRREKEANIKPDPDLDLFMKLIKMLGKSMKILEVDKRSLMLSSLLTRCRGR
ncbi:hypothetical protein Sjap_011291 [Stephania japonica]|uniref:Uncharacterized protein n=1 Tax=Stephania japonica TaxID=461633 RepID=A0AAP0JBD9_9MAGN